MSIIRVAHFFALAHGHTLHRLMHRHSTKKLPKGWWKARFVKDMQSEAGKRWWLIAWDGEDDQGVVEAQPSA